MEQSSLSPNLAGASQANGALLRLLRTLRVYYLGLKCIRGLLVGLRADKCRSEDLRGGAASIRQKYYDLVWSHIASLNKKQFHWGYFVVFPVKVFFVEKA